MSGKDEFSDLEQVAQSLRKAKDRREYAVLRVQVAAPIYAAFRTSGLPYGDQEAAALDAADKLLAEAGIERP
jgi:hypothetical protein